MIAFFILYFINHKNMEINTIKQASAISLLQKNHYNN